MRQKLSSAPGHKRRIIGSQRGQRNIPGKIMSGGLLSADAVIGMQTQNTANNADTKNVENVNAKELREEGQDNESAGQ